MSTAANNHTTSTRFSTASIVAGMTVSVLAGSDDAPAASRSALGVAGDAVRNGDRGESLIMSAEHSRPGAPAKRN